MYAINLKVGPATKAEAIDLGRKGHHLKTFLEMNEADSCIDGKECVSLGLQVAQLRDTIELMRNF